jgi:hypothetical protein
VETDRLPEWANEGAALVDGLHERGVLDGIADRLRIQREGGYVGLDLVLFLLFFLTARLDGGIKGFAERAAPHREQLGALGGRRRLPTPASVSRILAATAVGHAEALAEWLLVDACGATLVLRHPAVAAHDAVGDSWQVFDLDPKVTVLRQRALPDLDDTPPPRRRAIDAEPGYPGRKRGDVQLSRMTLQHAGSSLWMGLWLAPGNGEWREHSKAAIQRVRSICDSIGYAADHALVRVDGAGGNVPLITTCQDAGVRYLTRWSRYEILDEEEVRQHLNAASWLAVTDSGSGPRRQATDLGWVTLHPSDSTVGDDGSAYSPVRSRMVVSRFQARQPGKKRGAGKLIDGWQYELYVTDLPSNAWPAQDVVTTYYGRCGQENRFYQENQEIGLDHIFSYDVAGQLLANLVGLFLWNLRVCCGFELANVPAEVPAQPPRVAADVEAGILLIVEGAAAAEPERGHADAVAATTPGVDATVAAPELELVSGAAIPATLDLVERVDPTLVPDDAPPALDVAEPAAGSLAEARGALRLALASLEWERLLDDRPGWRWDPEEGLLCHNDEPQSLQSVKIPGRDRTRQLRFIAPYQACARCPIRAECTSSTNELFRKETAITVPTATAHPIHLLYEFIHARPSPPPPKVIAPVSPKPPWAPMPSPSPRSTASVRPDPPREAAWQEPGAFAVTAAVLLPAKLRQILTRTCHSLEVHVQVTLPERDEPVPISVFAITAAERQSRRLTWTQRLQRNALP